MKKQFYLFGILIMILSCNNNSKKNNIVVNEQYIQIDCMNKLDEVVVYDIYSPPVASRIYAYSNLAFYEAIKYSEKNATSLTQKMQLFDSLPKVSNSTINYTISAITAFFNTAKGLCFSKDSVTKKLNDVLIYYKENVDEKIYTSSVNYGNTIATTILARAAKDNYKYIKGLPKYTVVKEKNTWEQTPPDYADAVEPNWFLLKPMLIDSTMYSCIAPPVYNETMSSQYYKELLEVYETSKAKTTSMDSIAKYWDDNPFVTEHAGHFMAATKKITPVGHWLGITGIICKTAKANVVATAKAYALSSCAMYDGFIACWFQKYKTKMPRPITVIRKWFDPNWNAYLQTPPFPEYTSGHSVISHASATVLSNMFGNNISFTDTTENKYLGLQRSFTAITDAANEAGISRLYGGIHFKSAIENGKLQGKNIGEFYYTTFK
jgi:hypothetical protein